MDEIKADPEQRSQAFAQKLLLHADSIVSPNGRKATEQGWYLEAVARLRRCLLWCSPVPAPSTDTRADQASARRAAGAARGRAGRAGGPLWCGPSLGVGNYFQPEAQSDELPSAWCGSPDAAAQAA